MSPRSIIACRLHRTSVLESFVASLRMQSTTRQLTTRSRDVINFACANRCTDESLHCFTNEHSDTKANAFRAQQIQLCRGMLQLHAAAMAGNLHLD